MGMVIINTLEVNRVNVANRMAREKQGGDPLKNSAERSPGQKCGGQVIFQKILRHLSKMYGVAPPEYGAN